MRLERYTHFLSVWCGEGEPPNDKKEDSRTRAHTHMHLNHTHNPPRNPAVLHYRCSGGSAWPWSYTLELNLSGCLPFSARAYVCDLRRCTSASPRVCLSVSFQCVFARVSLFLCLTHTFFISRTVLRAYTRSHKSQGERVSARVRENKGN